MITSLLLYLLPSCRHHAEAILTKLGELYETGKIKSMPTPDLFNAVIGSWARRSPFMPFDAPARCIAILKHMEGIADNKISVDNGEIGDSSELHNKWSRFQVDDKTYQITFGAFRSALHCRTITESEHAFKIASEADGFLKHMINRAGGGRDEAIPSSEAYQIVAACYGKAIKMLAAEIQKEDEVLKEAGVAYIGIHYEGQTEQLLSALQRLTSLLEEIETGQVHTIASTISINAHTEALSAWASAKVIPDSEREALRILQKIIELYEDGNQNVSPTAEMFNIVVNALLQEGSVSSIQEASELLKEQERLHFDGNPSCKPSIVAYRSMLNAFADDSEEVASLLKRMTLLYESNVVDELHAERGNTSVGFNEIIQLWSEVDESSEAASWAESMLSRVANDVYDTSSRCLDSTQILRTKNFNAVIRAWLEAGKVHRAESLLEEMERFGDHHLLGDIKPDNLR